MNYHVILNEETTIYLSNIESVIYSNEDDTILFRDEKGNNLAAFKMYNIVGFYRVDVPAQTEEPISPEGMLKISKAALKHAVYNTAGAILQKHTPQWEWDFEKIDAITKKQQEEAEKKKHGFKYEDLVKYAKDRAEEKTITYKMIKEQMNEVMEECFKRGGIAAKGDSVPLYVRSLIQANIRQSTDEYELKYLEELLKRNMEHNLHGYDVYEGSK